MGDARRLDSGFMWYCRTNPGLEVTQVGHGPQDRGYKAKRPMRRSHRAFCSGDVLLSHNLSSHYHRGCSVSLPCSEWERVVPLRYDHQTGAARAPFQSGGES